MTHLAQLERDALCDTFIAVGPDAPTLCSPWTTADLAAHLVVRERRPDLAPGIWLPPLASRLESGMEDYAAKPWPELVELVRSGPPKWSPAQFAGVDDAFNFIEYFIHHEDVLRGDEAVGPRRELCARESRALWKMLSRMAKVFFRRSPVGVVLSTPEGQVPGGTQCDRARHRRAGGRPVGADARGIRPSARRRTRGRPAATTPWTPCGPLPSG